jgi:hypothetical protein
MTPDGDIPRYLTNAAFAGYAARIAQKAASWSGDTVQVFSDCLGDDADRDPVMRFISDMRGLLDHIERQVCPPKAREEALSEVAS